MISCGDMVQPRATCVRLMPTLAQAAQAELRYPTRGSDRRVAEAARERRDTHVADLMPGEAIGDGDAFSSAKNAPDLGTESGAIRSVFRGFSDSRGDAKRFCHGYCGAPRAAPPSRAVS